jgi:hypothetical protein
VQTIVFFEKSVIGEKRNDHDIYNLRESSFDERKKEQRE